MTYLGIKMKVNINYLTVMLKAKAKPCLNSSYIIETLFVHLKIPMNFHY